MKTCKRCKETKPLCAFSKNSKAKDKLQYVCKDCSKAITDEWKANNPEKYAAKKKRDNANREYSSEKSKEYRQNAILKNPEKELNRSKKRWADNKEDMSKKHKEWAEKNREYLREKAKRRYHTKKDDITFKLRHTLRTRINKYITSKSGSHVSDLGCSIPELKAHLESQFQDGMTWENHGDWHIDHIRPLASFDLSDRDQFLTACNYKNLQPLWAVDNIRKGAKYEI